MKKAITLIAIILSIFFGSLILVVLINYVADMINSKSFFASSSNNDFGMLFLTCISIIITSLLSYLIYKVNSRLSELTRKDHDSKIKESAYQIYYSLAFNIKSLIKQREDGTDHYSIRFEMKGDYINHIANLSQRLPDELIHDLYDIFIEFAYISDSQNSQNTEKSNKKSEIEKKNNRNVEKLFDMIFLKEKKITEDNYATCFNPRFSLIYNEIFEIISVSN